jgi:hypothetical protein
VDGHPADLSPKAGRESLRGVSAAASASSRYHPVVAARPDSDPDLERQRTAIETSFREGWRAMNTGQPRILTEREYMAVRRVLDLGAWAGRPSATVDAVRDGAQPGDPLPPAQPYPYIDRVTDTEVITTGTGPGRRVAVLFSHGHFPGIRFGHRFRLDPYAEGREQIWLKEEIETGALHRMMDQPPATDSAGIIWTTWGSPDVG